MLALLLNEDGSKLLNEDGSFIVIGIGRLEIVIFLKDKKKNTITKKLNIMTPIRKFIKSNKRQMNESEKRTESKENIMSKDKSKMDSYSVVTYLDCKRDKMYNDNGDSMDDSKINASEER